VTGPELARWTLLLGLLGSILGAAVAAIASGPSSIAPGAAELAAVASVVMLGMVGLAWVRRCREIARSRDRETPGPRSPETERP
jgi:drug/metabolite transporter (DMT)-like permease